MKTHPITLKTKLKMTQMAQKKAQKIAQETRLQNKINTIAKESVTPIKKVFVSLNGDTAEIPISAQIQKYKSMIDNTSQWAPWSIHFKKN